MPTTALNEIRKLVQRSEMTRYRIADESGVAESVLSRLVNRERRGLSLTVAERILAALGHELRIVPRRAAGGS